MSAVFMFVCRVAGMVLSGGAVLILAELVRYGVVTADGEAWSIQRTLTAFTVLFTFGFLLAFGGVKQ